MENVVVVRDGCKGFNGTPVLSNLNLRVKKGSIYGLLGASGCGKTTILSCIVGLSKLDSGTVRVFGSITGGDLKSPVPGIRVGYMPQDISLLQLFTIEEVLWYYGNAYGMGKTNINERSEFLKTLLQIPELNRMINSLSGGQQRRVSLAVSLIHEPPLLIMDEPTVGLDPVLRESIWNHLKELVNQKEKGRLETTIVMTTHYIEESSYCDKIGILRNGRLIVEENPHCFKNRMESLTLGLAVNKICRMDQNKKISTITNNCVENSEETNFNNLNIPDKETERNLNICQSLIWKILLLVFRDKRTLFTFLILPIIQLICVNIVIGKDPIGLKIGVLINDDLLGQQSMITNHCSKGYIHNVSKCFDNYTICSYLEEFKYQGLNLIPAKSLDEALQSVENGDSVGYIYFPSNFSTHMRDRVLFKNFARNETLNGSTISVKMDISNAVNARYVTSTLIDKLINYLKHYVKSCDGSPKFVEPALNYNSLYGDGMVDLITMIQPGLILGILFISSCCVGETYSCAKQSGALNREFVAGFRDWHIFISYFFAQSIIIVTQIVLTYWVSTFFGMVIRGSMSLAFLQLYLASATGISVGFSVGMYFSHNVDVIIFTIFLFLLNLYSSGMIWELLTVSKWYRPICKMLPITFPVASLQSIILRGYGLAHADVKWGLGASIFWIFAPFGILFIIKKMSNLKIKFPFKFKRNNLYYDKYIVNRN